MIDVGALGDKQLERGIDLIVAAGRALVALDQHHPRAGRHRYKDRTNVAAGFCVATKQRCSGRAIVAPPSMWITAPSPISAVLSATATSPAGAILPRCVTTAGSPPASASARDVIESPLSRALKIGQFGHERAVNESEPPHLDVAEHAARGLGVRLIDRIRETRQRLRLAHQRAQVGIFPFLDAAVRETLFGEHIERGHALRGNFAIARQVTAGLGKGICQRAFRRGLDCGERSVHATASS